MSRVTLLTAMADLMPCSWKKTLPPSSGHTVLISSLVIPRSRLPVSTPRLDTVLRIKRYRKSDASIPHEPRPRRERVKAPSRSPRHSHSGETFVLQPGFDLCGRGVHVQSHRTATVPLLGRDSDKVTCQHIGYSARQRVPQLTGRSSMGPLLCIGSRTFWGMWPSSPPPLRTSHHCLDF